MLRHLYRDIDGTLVDMSAYAPRLEWTASSKAEEGGIGSWAVVLDDPVGDLEILGHRNWFVEDDDSEDTDDIIWGGWTGAQTIARVQGSARRRYGPQARVISVELYDANTFLPKTIIRSRTGSRPAETDVQRMTWLLGLPATDLITDATTFVDTSGPVNMDKVSYRGQYVGQVANDCTSASGKNLFLFYRKVSGSRKLTIWYGRDTLPDYESTLLITNDRAFLSPPALLDGSATIWPLSSEAEMRRSPDRQYCGNFVNYGTGSAAVYVHNATTHAATMYGSGHRDMVSTLPLVRTSTKAKARATRQLADVQDQDIRIKTTLRRIPQSRVTLIKAGMLTQVKGTHWAPDDDDWHYARVLSADPTPRAVGRYWDIGLELSLGAESDGPAEPPFTGNAFAGLQRSRGNDTDQTGPLKYASTYDIGGGGWVTRTTTGPLAIVAGVTDPEGTGLVYYAIEALAPMDARIHARAHITGVYIPDAGATLNVRVNGSLIDSQSIVLSGLAAGTIMDVDVRDYHLEAGDIVSVDSAGSGLSDSIFWTNNGVNDTYLQVGRGTIYDNSGSQLIMVGP